MEDLTIKKFMIAFAALAMVMSCTTEKLTQDNPTEEPATNGTVVTLTANLPALTKATSPAFARNLVPLSSSDKNAKRNLAAIDTIMEPMKK